MTMRTERDSLGEVQVPDDRYYGAQTQRACENFCIGEDRFPREFIRAHALVKQAAAIVNVRLGSLEAELGIAIQAAAGDVIAGLLDDHFPLTIWQSGSATQTNMNVNEVIASRANERLGGRRGDKRPVHPNDHVNLAQSTNDTVPCSMHIAARLAVEDSLLPSVRTLRDTLSSKAAQFHDIVKVGRTHLQDATPLTLGQEFSGYAAQLDHAIAAIEACLPALSALPVGGTAVGTGLNTAAGFDVEMASEISRLTRRRFAVHANKFAGLAAHDEIVSLSGALRTLSAALMKIANDIRWLASGPRSGLGELQIPANEPGSSIMPGKVNPTQCEMVTMVACRVYGNDAAIAMAGAQGNFELNVYKPLMAHAILQSVSLLAAACRSFDEKCVRGIEADRVRIAELLGRSLMLVTALNPHIGYDRAAQIALKAWRENKPLRAAALESGLVSAEQFDEWVRPEAMLGPTERPTTVRT